jgi:NAD/NADP transhydrogenase beta subunit
MSGVLCAHMTASIGAVDLAVVITLLNAYSGLALAAEGCLIDKNLLTIVGALIASSGSELLYIMCTSMNRILANFILGGACTKTKVKSTVAAGEKPILEHSEATIVTVSDALTTAKRVTIVPGSKLFVSGPSSLYKVPPRAATVHILFTTSARETNSQKVATRSHVMTKIYNHKNQAMCCHLTLRTS